MKSHYTKTVSAVFSYFVSSSRLPLQVPLYGKSLMTSLQTCNRMMEMDQTQSREKLITYLNMFKMEMNLTQSKEKRITYVNMIKRSHHVKSQLQTQ
ncbi:hypothetical protein HA466_0028920 [Hirschfeldia incana]|nr:hypothetical protein HA466_0028920 [Hirschfeldia incana]